MDLEYCHFGILYSLIHIQSAEKHVLAVQMGTSLLKSEKVQTHVLCCYQVYIQEQNQGITPNLFSDTTDLACHICSRIPKANHDYSLPLKAAWVLVLPTVEISALEVGDSCEGRVTSRSGKHWLVNFVPKLEVRVT